MTGAAPTLVFDFAGVLFQWHPPRLLRRALPRQAFDDASAEALVKAIFQGYGGDWHAFDRGDIGVDELVGRIAERTGLEPGAVRAVVDGVPLELQPIGGTVDLLQRLRAGGRRLYYLSNMPAPYARHLEASHRFIGDCFDDGVISARVGLAKPDPAIFELAAARFGVPPAGLAFIDDVAVNVDAARAAGWQALRFADPAQCEAELRERGWI